MIGVRKVNSYDVDEASLASGFNMSGMKSRTIQSHAVGTSVNEIVKAFRVTGVLPQGIRRPEFGDFTEAGDFRSSLDAIMLAQKSFNQLSSDVRERFGNDPGRFVAFCSDDKNLDEMRAMGLAVPPKVVEPVEVRIMNPPVVPLPTT